MNLLSTRSASAATASAACVPRARIFRRHPGPAANIINPMIEIPETALPLLATVISAEKEPASLTNLAAARA